MNIRLEPDGGGAASGRSAGDGLVEIVGELLDRLADLQGELRELLALADAKLEALRRADADGLQRCSSAESQRLERVLRLNRERAAVLARLAQRLHWPEAASASLSDIAARVGEPLGSRLRARSVPLREVAAQLEKKNRVAALVARNLQEHVRAIFATVAEADAQPLGYTPGGRLASGGPTRWIDAVG